MLYSESEIYFLLPFNYLIEVHHQTKNEQKKIYLYIDINTFADYGILECYTI